MRAVEVIREKRSGQEHHPATIQAFLRAYLSGQVTDYQMSAWLMAVYFQGMTPAETAELTKTMMRSGHTYELETRPPAVDKHSTGGVGDKISLILAPLAAACGIKVPMVSGRGLGHTGGTLDKLESIPGFQICLEPPQVLKQLDQLGVVMIGQSENFVPADRRLYALRDVTGTVESIPLITASILSKKAASGARGLVMDVKVGTGAFMDTTEKAQALARSLIATGHELGLNVVCLLTDMGVPLGVTVGNALEVHEAVDVLMGQGPKDVRDLTIELCAEMILLARPDQTVHLDHARQEAARTLDRGKALEKFRELILAQGGNPEPVLSKELPISPDRTVISSQADGFVGSMDMRAIGDAACLLGAGRQLATDSVDHGVGLEILIRPGQAISVGQPMAVLYHRDGKGLTEATTRLIKAIPINSAPPLVHTLILERITV